MQLTLEQTRKHLKKMVVVINGKKEKDREGERKEEIKGRVVDRMGAVGV